MLFWQSAAPTGWTQVTTQNNKALRIVSGTGGGTGGTVAFTTAFASQAVSGTNASGAITATTLSTAQMPSHSHTLQVSNNCGGGGAANGGSGGGCGFPGTSSTGGGGSHTHGFTQPTFTGTAINLAVQYIDIILCSKN
jgi:hypothetical protein